MSTAAATRRSRRSRSRPTPIQWQRVGRLALLGTLAVIVLLYVPPVMHWVQQRQTAGETRSQVRALQREHDRLESRLRLLSTPAGIGRAAEALGMVRHGERPYVIEGGLPAGH